MRKFAHPQGMLRELRLAIGGWLLQRAFYVLPEGSMEKLEVAQITCRWYERLRGGRANT